MKKANEDHKLLRSITRDTITNELELIDLGLQLDLPPSMVKQKLHDYPRSIETASYMVASEWWDSCSSSREEKYGLLLDTVHSMGKNNTAQCLENVILEKNLGIRNSNHTLDRISSSQGGLLHPLTNSASNEIDNDNYAAVSGRAGIAGLDSNRSNLAICDAITDPDGNSGNLEGDVGDVNIVEITDEEHSTQGQFSGRNSCEIQYSFPPSVENEALDIFEGSPASVNFHESEMTDRPTDTTHLDSSANGQPPFASNSHETEMKVDISQLKGPVSSKWTGTSVKCGEKKLNICERSDSYVPMSETISRSAASSEDLDIFGQAGMETENIESARLSKLSREVDIDDFGEPVRSVKNSEQLPDSDVWFDGSQSERRMLKNDEESSEKGNFKKRRFQTRHEGNFERLVSDVENEDLDVSVSVQSPLLGKTRPPSHTIDIEDPQVVDHLLPEVHILNAQSHDAVFQPCVNVTVGGQTGVVNGQTGVENGQTGVVNGQTGVVNGQTGVVNGQTGVVNGQTGAVNGQTGAVNGHTGAVNGHTGAVNGHTGAVNGQTGVDNRQTCIVDDQTGVCVQNGQRGAENRQTAVVNGKVIEQNKDESKKMSSGFLQRIYRRLFRRKKPVAADEADAKLAVPLSEVKTTDS